MTQGIFITFEGVEGCGKSTQIALLNQYLTAKGYDVVLTREPGGTSIAEQIRTILLNPANTAMTPTAELFLYEAARAQHIGELIRPALDAGKIVLCDRFADSTTAYQGAGRGIDPAQLEKLHEWTTGGLRPHLTLLLDLPVEQGLARAAQHKDTDRLERENIEFHQRVREAFWAVAQRDPFRVKIINGAASPEEVAAEIHPFVTKVLERRV